MNTSTRARFTNANQAHASTAHQPIIRPEGIVMPSPQRVKADRNYDRVTAQRLHWAAHPEQHCRAMAAVYQRALDHPQLQLPVTAALLRDARAWLRAELSHVTGLGFWPEFVDRESLLPETLLGFMQSPQAGGIALVPITSLYNVPHPVWTPIENLLFRFVHDYHHHITGAGADFVGELAVTRHILTPAVRANEPLARFLASEPVGQSALFIVSGTYPQQVVARSILDLV